MRSAGIASVSTLLVVCLSAACATKRDVDALRGELAMVQSRQDSIASSLESLERAIAGQVEENRSLLVATRGDLRQQLDDIERQLVQIQELMGQSQAVLNRLRGRVESREWEQPEVAGRPAADTGVVEPRGEKEGAGGQPRALYAAAIEQFRRGAYETARTGFEEFLVTYPGDELAPDAQYYLAETYREGGDRDRAIREYNRVIELYPNSEAAPTALYKAGLLQIDAGNKDSACQYFQRVIAGYPRSDESRLARSQAERHGCR